MPRKRKESGRKLRAQSNNHPQLSDHSLVVVPEDAVEGYQERIVTGIEWTLQELTAREHKNNFLKTKIPTRTFTEALQRKLEASVLGGFLNEHCKMSPEEYLDTIVNISLWEEERITDSTQNICLKNSLTNDMDKLIKKAVKLGDRKALSKELKKVSFLRLSNIKITDVDRGLSQYKNLEHLVLCGNFIKNLPGKYLPRHIKILELQSNGISNIKSFVNFTTECIYLGLARNLLCDESLSELSFLSYSITILDLEDNNINSITLVLKAVATLPSLLSLTLAGNPCSVCAGYAIVTLSALPYLKWLDNRNVLETDRHPQFSPKQLPTEIHPNDLKSAWFVFKVLRIMSTPLPPRLEKGVIGTFHVELEIPLLDSKRRQFLMYRENEFLVEYPPEPENGWEESYPTKPSNSIKPTVTTLASTEEDQSSDLGVYRFLQPKNSHKSLNYRVFESNKVHWQNIMTFQNPIVRIFCPDLVSLRDTFRSVITIRFVYTTKFQTMANSTKQSQTHLPASEYRLVLATVKCALKNPDWSQMAQHFHWDKSMGTDEAIHWGDGNLEILRYVTTLTKAGKLKKDFEQVPRQQLPENLTCHFSFGIERLI